MNTRIRYLYRDASNFKQNGEIVVGGQITFADLEPFLDDGIYFVPEDVGLSHPGERWNTDLGLPFPTEDDHPSCELEEGSFESTNDPAEVDAQVLIDRFRQASAAGWPGLDRNATLANKCGKCGAISTGGAYCPNGCGAIRPGATSVPSSSSNQSKGRVVPKTCARCGAASSGGAYCPNGCGKI